MRLYPIFFLILISAINQASAANVNYTQDRRYIFSLSNNGANLHVGSQWVFGNRIRVCLFQFCLGSVGIRFRYFFLRSK